jgi:peroxiredoxin
MEKEQLTWRSFVDQGAIAAQWNISASPTYYVIDHKGLIRYKWLGSPGDMAVDAALEKVIQDAERDAKKAPQ